MERQASNCTLTEAKSNGSSVELQESEHKDRVSKSRSKVWTKVAWFSRKARNSDLMEKDDNFAEHKESIESMEQFNGVHYSWSSDDSLDSIDDQWLMESDNTANSSQAKPPLDEQLKGCVSRARAVFAGGQPLPNNVNKFVTRGDSGTPTNDHSADINCDTNLQATIEDFSETCEGLLEQNQSTDSSTDDNTVENHEEDVDGLLTNDSPSTTENKYSVSVQFDSIVYESEHTACSDAEASSPVGEPQLTVNASPPNSTVSRDTEYKTPQKASTVLSEHSRSTLAIRRIATPPYSAPLLRHHFPLLRSGSPSLSSLKNLSPCNSCSSIDAASLPGKLSEVGHSRLVQRAMSVPQNAYNNCSPILGMRNDTSQCFYERNNDCPFNHSQVHCNSPDIRQGSSQDIVKRLYDLAREDNSSSPLYKPTKRSYACSKVSDPLTQVPEMIVEKMLMEECDSEGVLTRNEDHGSNNSLHSVMSGLQKLGGPVGQQSERGSLWSLRSRCSSTWSRPGSHYCEHTSYSKGVAGNVFKERMEVCGLCYFMQLFMYISCIIRRKYLCGLMNLMTSREILCSLSYW